MNNYIWYIWYFNIKQLVSNGEEKLNIDKYVKLITKVEKLWMAV